MECSKERPHALLLPYPAQGHINPMMLLGKRLAALGVRVTFATMQHIHSKISRTQQPISDCHGDFSLQAVPDGLPADVDREAWSKEYAHGIDEKLEEGALELIHTLAAQGCPVTLIIGDFFLRGTCSLARRTALPEFILWPQCAFVFSIYFHLDSIISSGYHPFQHNVKASSSREDFKEMVSCIPGLPQLHPGDLPFEMPFGKVGLEWVEELLRFRLSHLNEAEGLLINSFEALEEEVGMALKCGIKQQNNGHNIAQQLKSIKFLGPLVASPCGSKDRKELTLAGGCKTKEDGSITGASLWEEEVEECMQWLDEQPQGSVVLVAFGSVFLMSADQVHELAVGLAASGQRILWVIRKDSIGPAKPETVLETTEGATELEEALPRGFLEANKERCKVVRWAPQARVLSHASVGGFFSHCGWNSTLESMCAGVPILGWPWLMDQVTNCWLLTHVWKIGLTLPRNVDDKASKDDIASCLKQLMEGPRTTDLRARARELSRLAQEATTQSTPLLQSFIDDIVRPLQQKRC